MYNCELSVKQHVNLVICSDIVEICNLIVICMQFTTPHIIPLFYGEVAPVARSLCQWCTIWTGLFRSNLHVVIIRINIVKSFWLFVASLKRYLTWCYDLTYLLSSKETVSENKYSLICYTFTGTLNQLHFIFHLISFFSFFMSF